MMMMMLVVQLVKEGLINNNQWFNVYNKKIILQQKNKIF